MGLLKVGQENQMDIEIYFEDLGAGEPVILIHGYPFSGAAWERQTAALLASGFRVITYDRRGFGKSSQPSVGYDYDTFAADLNRLIEHLQLDHVTLIGHSMGTGEIARYISRYGSEKISKAIMVSPIPPYLLENVEQKVFDGIKDAIRKDRYAYMTEFLKNFYNVGVFNTKLSEEKLRADFNLGVSSSATAFLACVDTWLEDFRGDITKINIPLLVIQGDADKILPIDATGKLLVETVGELKVIPGGSHGIPWTDYELVNEHILTFMQENQSTYKPFVSNQTNIYSDIH